MKKSAITEAKSISADLLKSLILEQTLSIAVKDFLQKPALEYFQSRLLEAESSEKGFDGGAPINRIGRPWFTSKHGNEYVLEYFQQARSFHDYMGEICCPYLPPVDVVIRSLDRIWPGGAKIGKIDGQTMCAGLVRDITQGKSLPWHVDANRFGPDGYRGTILDKASAILFGNVYIVCDGKSGRLQCHNQRPNPLAYKEMNSLGYGAGNIELEADVDYQPTVGDLVMGHADKWHRVLATEGRRITSSFFVAVYGEDQPLIIYS